MSKEIEVEETEDEVNYVDVEIDLPESVIDYYKALAKAEGVSFNDMINIVLQKFLDDEEQLVKIFNDTKSK